MLSLRLSRFFRRNVTSLFQSRAYHAFVHDFVQSFLLRVLSIASFSNAFNRLFFECFQSFFFRVLSIVSFSSVFNRFFFECFQLFYRCYCFYFKLWTLLISMTARSEKLFKYRFHKFKISANMSDLSFFKSQQQQSFRDFLIDTVSAHI